MVETLKIYTYIDGINDTPFPNLENQIKISEYTYTSQRMGSVSLSATIMYKDCLDNVWSGNEYVTFQGEKYFIKDTPTSSKTNDDERYKHELEFVGERAILDMVYFYDVIIDANDENRYQSNSTKVIFSGDIAQFVQRFNYTLQYSNIGYNVVIDNGISSDNKTVSFEDKYISEALQEIFNIYELPYYFVGKTIHVGYTNNAITQIFKYGIDESLLSITKTNANYAITNRCTGIGSTENIPYYYPNDTDNRKEIESSGGTWITPSQNLMPPKYRDTNGLERFYNALNNTYISPQTGEYYHFDNVYNGINPKEIKVSFDDIKPTIKGALNAIGDRIDQIADIAFDDKDNDDLKPESETEYQHPYFFVKLRKTDGTYGFNLFDKAIVGTDMSLSMTDGNCSACNFTISVDSETMKNPVQVDEKGNLKRDKDGNVIIVGTAQDKQNDTEHNEVWLALKKDISTFGVIMPNASFGYKPSIGDTFVVLGIILPKSYILNAENKLKEEIIKYMATNNNEKFTFSINFSRIYLEENPIIANQINENARVQIEYNNSLYELYISNYTYKVTENIPLPEITVELEDTITISTNSIKTQIDSVKQDIMNSVGSIDFLKQGLKYFIRKDVNDYPKNVLTFSASQKFKGGAEFGTYETGLLGSGAKISPRGYIEARGLTLWETLEVPEIRYNKISVYTGIKWDTFGGGIIQSVEIDKDADGNSLQSGIITLKQEAGEFGAIDVDDLCMGIFHQYNGDNDNITIDGKNMNFNFKGFRTSYFRITEILDTANNGKFRYNLRGISNSWAQLNHPSASMNFACYANPSNTNRQSCKYSTTTYSIRLENMTNWEYNEDNIYQIEGKLDGFQMNGKKFYGNGIVFGNAYMFGALDEFERIPNKMSFIILGDNMIAAGETKHIESIITNGYGTDVTNEYTTWKLTRETGNVAADLVWNTTAVINNGKFDIKWTDAEDDLNGKDSAMFIIEATKDGNSVKGIIEL